MRRITVGALALLALGAAGCGGSAVADEIVHTYGDGSVATVATATESELRDAAIAMETIYTTSGSYDGGDVTAQMESVGDGRLYPTIDLRTIEASADSYCVEGGKDGFVMHVRTGEWTPQDGAC